MIGSMKVSHAYRYTWSMDYQGSETSRRVG